MAAKTLSSGQMAWMLKKGYAWASPENAGENCSSLAEVYWTAKGGYMWNVELQKYELCL